MTHKEYIECLKCELYRDSGKYSLLRKIRVKYFQPNTNCMYLCRKMWYLYSRGRKLYSKILYLKIIRKYGCIIYPYAKVGKGFHIAHPTGIVIGKCEIGANFTCYQNATIGVRNAGDEARGKTPIIGDNCKLCSGGVIVGDVKICDNVTIGALSFVSKSIERSGIYVGIPAKRIDKEAQM